MISLAVHTPTPEEGAAWDELSFRLLQGRVIP